MAQVTYSFYPDSQQRKDQLQSAHDAYAEPFLSRSGGKIDRHLYEYGLRWKASNYYAGYVGAMANSFGTGDGNTEGMPDEEHNLDNATADELKQFADNDQWVKADDVVQTTKIEPQVMAMDPNKAFEINEDG